MSKFKRLLEELGIDINNYTEGLFAVAGEISLEERKSMAKHHVQLLTGNPNAIVCIQVMPEKKNKGRAKILHGTIVELFEELDAFNQTGHIISVMVNESDGQGRKAENIKAIRAFFIDHDAEKDGPLKRELPLKPSFTIASGHGFHHYYLLEEPVGVEHFKTMQLGMAIYCGTDRGIFDLCRVMRLAGFYNNKEDEPVLVHIVEVNDD